MNMSPQSEIWWKISKNLSSMASLMNGSHVFILFWRVVENISKHSNRLLLLIQALEKKDILELSDMPPHFTFPLASTSPIPCIRFTPSRDTKFEDHDSGVKCNIVFPPV
jgi:hypothetical protein